MPLPRRVRIVEVGPRDGLQNEAAPVPTVDKIAFVNRLAAAGHSAIEVTAFVSPKWVPQMADAADVLAGIDRRAGVTYSALVPNRAGLERAQAARVDELAIFAAASETFSERNINQPVAASMAMYRELCGEALRAGYRVRAYLSTVFGCPFEGAVPVDRVLALTAELLDMGAYEVALSDTIGIAHPGQVPRVLEAVLAALPADRVALHFHDTRGTALVNVYAALEAGVASFDASSGGLGGCPYAPGATGNIVTEDLVFLLESMGFDTGIDLDKLFAARAVLAEALPGEPLYGHVPNAGLPKGFTRAAAGRAGRAA